MEFMFYATTDGQNLNALFANKNTFTAKATSTGGHTSFNSQDFRSKLENGKVNISKLAGIRTGKNLNARGPTSNRASKLVMDLEKAIKNKMVQLGLDRVKEIFNDRW
jgi:hypothetical protein